MDEAVKATYPSGLLGLVILSGAGPEACELFFLIELVADPFHMYESCLYEYELYHYGTIQFLGKDFFFLYTYPLVLT
jgi:hypothetical protein